MDIISLVAIALVGAVLGIILRQYKPEFGIYISLLVGIVVLSAVIAALIPALDSLNELVGMVELAPVYGQILLKALAICCVTQLAADSCRDAGESAIASKIEMAGKAAILVIALPLFENLVGIVTNLIG